MTIKVTTKQLADAIRDAYPNRVRSRAEYIGTVENPRQSWEIDTPSYQHCYSLTRDVVAYIGVERIELYTNAAADHDVHEKVTESTIDEQCQWESPVIDSISENIVVMDDDGDAMDYDAILSDPLVAEAIDHVAGIEDTDDFHTAMRVALDEHERAVEAHQARQAEA